MEKRTLNESRKYIPFPPARFIVLSDIHYYDTSLGTTGTAFEVMQRKNKEVKMIKDSPGILQAAKEALLAENIDFIIICGDLTKDGEASSHALLVPELQEILAAGTKVFVINGNHDVGNDQASRYFGDKKKRTATVSGKEFREIYADFGYNVALERDSDSLSYVVEPVPGLWLLAMDSCRWREKYFESGRFYPHTLSWIKKILTRAKEEKKAVLGMMHHGLLEHYPGNRKYYKDYLVNDNTGISELFLQYGLKVVFTGHFHAQDVALQRTVSEKAGNYIYDIETGSLITYPCPYRLITIDNQQTMHIRSKRIEATADYPTGFAEYAYQHACASGESVARETLKSWFVTKKDVDILTPQIVKAFLAHAIGNETPAPEKILDFQGISWWGKFIMSRKKTFLEGLWQQSLPPDNDLSIDLKTGEYQH